MDDTEKAIEFLEGCTIIRDVEGENTTKNVDKVLQLLRIGKMNSKYKQIVEDIRQYIIDRRIIEEDFCTNGNEIIDLINWLKRKNFPESKTLIKKTKLDKAIKEIRDMRIAAEKYENEKKYDKWFESLNVQQQADVAYNFWDNASYEGKKEEYELE